MSAIPAIPGASGPAAPVAEVPERNASRAPVAVDSGPTPAAPGDDNGANPLARHEDLVAVGTELVERLRGALGDDHVVSLRLEEEIDTYVVEVRQRDSGELIRQFPPEKILNMRRYLDELVGTVIDRLS